MVQLPSGNTRDIAVDDVAPPALNTLLGESGRDEAERLRRAGSGMLEVLSVETISRQPRRWPPVMPLVFAATDFDDLGPSVVIDDLDSKPTGSCHSRHGLATPSSPPTSSPSSTRTKIINTITWEPTPGPRSFC